MKRRVQMERKLMEIAQEKCGGHNKESRKEHRSQTKIRVEMLSKETEHQ